LSIIGSDTGFLTGGGATAELIARYDWSRSLGPIGAWPQSLKTTVGLMIHSPVPLVLLWGEDGIMLYNDAYSVFAGKRHPQLLGNKVLEGWPEVADFNAHVMEVGLAGGTLEYKQRELVLNRHGTPQAAWMDLFYSPVIDESGKPGGVIAVVVETTQRVLAARKAIAEREALRDSEQRLQMALSAGDGVGTWDWDVPNDRVVADARFAMLYGVDPQTARDGASIEAFFANIHPDDMPQVQSRVADVLRTGETFSEEYRLVQPDGSVRWVIAQGRCTLAADGTPLRFPGVSFDITARKAVEAQLRASEKQFRTMAQAVPHHVWTASADGLLDWFNARVYAFSGAEQGSLDGTGWTVMVHPDDLAEAAPRWAHALETGQIYETEFRLHRADGQWRWHLARAVPVKDADGTVTRWIGTNTDIHDQTEAVEALRELNADLEARVLAHSLARGRTWQLSPDLIGVLNGEGVFETSNPAWQIVLGWSEREIASTYFFDFIHPDDQAKTQGAWVAAMERGEPALRFENRYRHKDGHYRWLSWVAVPDEGKIYCNARDITIEKEREAELLQAQDALRQSQKMEAVGQLTGGIAHDFNNLLQGITGAIDRVQHRIKTGRPMEAEKFLKAASDSANRAAALTHRLLAFSRRQTLDPKPVDPNRLIAGMEDLINRTMGPNVSVEVVGAAGLWPIRVDPPQLENSLLNLCINARDAMPDGGKLTIETANKWMDDRAARERDIPPGQYVSLCVTDTGTGMTPEVSARAFDPFYTTKPIGSGTGLGLSMIYGFVRQSGGQVRIYSELGKGTTMCLYFPRHLGSVEEEDEARSELVERGFGETVLVVDDEQTVRMLIAEVLNEGFYNILEAQDGPSALKVLESDKRIDLLITDVGLPGGMNGRQVADAARALRKDLKVLFITGYAENAVVGNGHLEPGMQILAKPFAMSTLANKVREMIEG